MPSQAHEPHEVEPEVDARPGAQLEFDLEWWQQLPASLARRHLGTYSTAWHRGTNVATVALNASMFSNPIPLSIEIAYSGTSIKLSF